LRKVIKEAGRKAASAWGRHTTLEGREEDRSLRKKRLHLLGKLMVALAGREIRGKETEIY